MAKNMKRTFSLSKAVLKKLDVLHDCYNIDRATFIRMAVYHGIERIRNGYYPYRNHNLKTLEKQKYNVVLPEETWEILKEAKKAIKYQLEEPIPDGEMIELFIRMEIKGYVAFTNQYLKDDEADDFEIFGEDEEIRITATIPKVFYDKMQEEICVTGLGAGKVGKYLITSALLQECCHTSYEMIDTDADLIRYIEACGLNTVKTLTLLRNLVHANKIMFLNDKQIDY